MLIFTQKNLIKKIFNMKKIWIIFSIIIITFVFIYTMNYISESNSCTWVRVFDCKKNLVSDDYFKKLKPYWDIFLKYCNPKISKEKNLYLLDYSNCNLKVNISEDIKWIEGVNVNWMDLTRDEINSNF